MTPLLAAVLEEHGGAEGVVAFSLTARPVDFARFAPRVVGSLDPAALAIMERAVSDVAEAVDLLQGGGALPVVLLGGLGPVYAERLAGRWAIQPSKGSALDGALWLAREAGAGASG
jgi:glucosamine kinase